MMQAQLERAGHEETFATILQDTRNATQREKRRKIATNYILVRRGQGKCVSAILASKINMPFNTKTFYTLASLKSPYLLPHVLNV
jgi:hypothetical protein